MGGGREVQEGGDICILMADSGFRGGSDSKESACNAGDPGSIPGLGRSPEGVNSYPLQYSGLENPHGQRSLEGYGPRGCTESDTAWLIHAAVWKKSNQCKAIILQLKINNTHTRKLRKKQQQKLHLATGAFSPGPVPLP